MANRMVDVIKAIWNGRSTTPIADMVALLGSVLWNFASGITVVGTTTTGIINASGKITVSAGGANITGGLTADNLTLGAGTALAQYVEGTFVPTIVGLTTAGVGTYGARVGTYTRVGQFVLFRLRVDWTAHTGTGAMAITGFPFPVSATAHGAGTMCLNNAGITAGAQGLLVTATSRAEITTSVGNNQNVTATGSVIFTGLYPV